MTFRKNTNTSYVYASPDGESFVPLSCDENGVLRVDLTGEPIEVSFPTPMDVSLVNPAVVSKELPDDGPVFSPANATTTAYAASLMVKEFPGNLYSVVGYNSKTSSQFIQVHDTNMVPDDGAVPSVIFRVPAESNFSYSADKFGRFFANGIYVCNSSTGPVKTIDSNDCWFDVGYL